MAFAPFPPATYLSDGARTEGEMKTAFENWLLASRQMEHGQCRLAYVSPTSLQLLPAEGRRVLVNGLPFLVPTGGMALTNSGLVANTFYYIVLFDEYVDGACVLRAFNASGANVHVVDPDSGVSMMSFNAGASVDTRVTVVGYAVTDSASQFTTAGVTSLHRRQLVATTTTLLGGSDFSTGSATPLTILALQTLGFKGDSFAINATLSMLATAVAGMVLQVYNEGVAADWVGVTAPAGQAILVPFTWMRAALANDAGAYIELKATVSSGGPVTFYSTSRLVLTRVA